MEEEELFVGTSSDVIKFRREIIVLFLHVLLLFVILLYIMVIC